MIIIKVSTSKEKVKSGIEKVQEAPEMRNGTAHTPTGANVSRDDDWCSAVGVDP